jgi:GGDEF domain-containing protein
MPGNRITVSLGLAAYPEDGTSANILLHQADQMLYRGKKKRGQFTL